MDVLTTSSRCELCYQFVDRPCVTVCMQMQEADGCVALRSLPIGESGLPVRTGLQREEIPAYVLAVYAPGYNEELRARRND